MLLKSNNNFWNDKVWERKKTNPRPLTPQKWPCLRKNHKKLRFSNFRPKKHQLGANQYSNISCYRFLGNWMRITKLFSKSRLVKIRKQLIFEYWLVPSWCFFGLKLKNRIFWWFFRKHGHFWGWRGGGIFFCFF